MTLELIDARDDRHLWSRTFDRKLTDVMTLQSQVAAEIAGQLRRSLVPNVGLPPSRNPAAYDLWLQGVLAWQNVGGGGAAPREIRAWRICTAARSRLIRPMRPHMPIAAACAWPYPPME